MTGYTRVGSFPTRAHAELALTYLQDHGIHAVVIADDGGGAYPPMAWLTGGVAIGVAERDVEVVRRLLADAEAEPSTLTAEDLQPPMPPRPVMKWVLRAAAAAVLVMLALSALPPR